ncbi:MAG TPA: hypothetical protein VJ863_08465, partial [Sphaerochaeta sp.]|nr:hypothetical protein [Sphaerochaeta sp.]
TRLYEHTHIRCGLLHYGIGRDGGAQVDSPDLRDIKVLHYGIKTNSTTPLIVKANISAFEEQEVPYPAKVPIARIDALSSFGSSTLDVGPEGAHDLLALTPTVGRVFYTYRLAVFVGQNTVLDAPVGKYVAPLVLHIGAVSQSNMLHDKE